MFSIIDTAFFYGTLWMICVLFSWIYERNKILLFKYLPYLIILFVSITRFDIGSDYGPQFLTIRESLTYKNGLALDSLLGENGRSAPGLTLLTIFFSPFPNTPVWVINFFFIVFLFFFYKFADKLNIHKWAIFLLFSTTLLFQSWDWIRQSAAMAVSMYAYTLIGSNHKKKIILLLLLAVILHLSALAIIPVLLVGNRFRIKNTYLSIFLLVMLVLAMGGLFKPFYEKIIEVTPFFGESYARSSRYATKEEFLYFAPSYIFFAIWYIVLLFFSNKENYFWNFLLFLGGFLFIASGNSLLIDRIAIYFSIAQFFIFPSIIKKCKDKRMMLLFGCLIAANIVLIGHRFLKKGDMRGCVPYETMFSHEYEYLLFRPDKEY